MPGGAVIMATADVNRVEAPVTFKAYLMCAFAAFAGIFFGYDSGYISGVMGMKFFIQQMDGQDATAFDSSEKSLVTSILSAGTFVGSLMAGDFADFIGRRPTIIAGCVIFIIGGKHSARALAVSKLTLTNQLFFKPPLPRSAF